MPGGYEDSDRSTRCWPRAFSADTPTKKRRTAEEKVEAAARVKLYRQQARRGGPITFTTEHLTMENHGLQ